MRYLTQNEKVHIILLITAFMVMVVISVYLGMNIQRKNYQIFNRKIYAIHTCGEIEPDFENTYNKNKDKIVRHDMFNYKPMLKSSDIIPNDWNNIAKNIGENYDSYDAFVIVHSKESIPYTASALSFMLENLGKPVILTDGELASSLILASETRIPEVMISSQGKLLRGCRTYIGINGFNSNHPNLELYNSLVHPSEPMQIRKINPKIKIIVIKSFPGIDDVYLSSIITSVPVHGIIFEIDGNFPSSPKFLAIIQQLLKKGIIIIAISQNFDNQTLPIGVINGLEMNVCSAYTKLCFILSNVKDKHLTPLLMEQSLKGEIDIKAGVSA